jgi:phenylalanyl-tRNA synthetase alpha chain
MQVEKQVRQKLEAMGVHDEAVLARLFQELRAQMDRELRELTASDGAEQFRVRWLGRKQGLLTAANDNWLKPAAPALKRSVGRFLNELKQYAESALETRRRELDEVLQATRLETEQLDVTLPGIEHAPGARHPVRAALEEIEEIFFSMGYSVAVGPEIETDYYNFEALNFPREHPARDMQATLWVAGDYLLRTHTSPVQIRTMERQPPPLRVIAPGKVYRRDNPDATHSFMFHQVEGLAVDTNITFCDLKGTLDHFLKRYFGERVRTRFRPSFFPFTEPSAEVDISCIFCDGRGCRICKQVGWIELLGCGMVDPSLYSFVHYDAAKYSGFAFGMGVERFVMLRYGIDDIQAFFQGDLRFLRQFR